MAASDDRERWERADWVELRCPGCRNYLVTLPKGTLIKRGYCRACSLKFVERVV